MDIRELRSFMYVAQLQSFTRAAAELNIAQPALSRQIRKLEEELGVALLTRHARGVTLTASGAILLRRAEFLIHSLRQVREEIAGDEGPVTGHIALAVPPAAGAILVPPFLTRFRAELPNVSLHLLEAVSGPLQDWLINRRVDVAVLHNPPAVPAIAVHPLLEEQLYLIAPAGPGPAAYRIRDLQDLPLILPGYPHVNRLLVEQAAARHGIRLKLALEVDGVALTRDLVADGFGFGLLTLAAVSRQVAAGRLAAIPLRGSGLVSTLAVAHHASAPMTPALAATIALLQRTVRELVEGGAWDGGVSLAPGERAAG